jgi:hypothetical protein
MDSISSFVSPTSDFWHFINSQVNVKQDPALIFVSQQILQDENRILTLFQAAKRWMNFYVNSTDTSQW